jgi:5-methylcytosine-specific restriction endonuclease McrA
MKTCRRCKQNKKQTEFYKNSAMADGLQNYCKSCIKESRQGKKYQSDGSRSKPIVLPGHKYCRPCNTVKPTSEFFNSKSRSDGLADECKECRKKASMQWKLKNPERDAELRREQQKRAKSWLKPNGRDYVRMRRVSRHTLGLKANRVLFSDVVARDKWVCKICGKPVDKSLAYPDPFSPSLDHVVPVSKGGSHTLGNLQLAHLRCNLKKYNHSNSQSVSIL